MLRRPFALAACVLLAATAALAAERAPTAEETKALSRDLAAFARATEKNDAKAVIDALPERVLPSVARTAGMTPAQVRDTLVQSARAYGAQSQPQGVAADLSGLRLSDVPSQTGGTLSWGILKLSGSAVNAGKRAPFSATTLALREGKDWHFARIDAPGQTDLIENAYPELKGLPRSK